MLFEYHQDKTGFSSVFRNVFVAALDYLKEQKIIEELNSDDFEDIKIHRYQINGEVGFHVIKQ